MAGVRDSLDFSGKLEALDHYARVLILDHAYHAWMDDQSPRGGGQSDEEKVTKFLDAALLDWVDRNKTTSSRLAGRVDASDSLEWRSCSAYIHLILARWLTDRSQGPIVDIIRLRRRKLVLFKRRRRYCVKMEIYQDFTTDPCIADCYPARVAMRSTVEKANEAARKALREGFGGKSDARIWNEVYEDDGRARIRYQDVANSAKAVAWVEEELVDEPIIDASKEPIKEKDRRRMDGDEESEEDGEDGEEDEDDYYTDLDDI